MDYLEFLESKKHSSGNFGVKPEFMPAGAFDYQEFVSDYLIRKGRAAAFLDTGTGKTIIELTVAVNYARQTNKPVLILTPLAVAFQFIKEADKFGIDDISYSKDGKFKTKIVVANYERLHLFNSTDFDCVILDECFAPDTKIKVLNDKNILQEKHIKDCLVGEKVLNCTGFDTITEVKSKKIDYAIKIGFNGQQIISSGRHPYFTQRGWVAAKDIQKDDFIMSTDEAMRILRGGLSGNIQGGFTQEVLRDILFSEMENEPTGVFSESTQSNSCCEERERKGGISENGCREDGNRKDKEFKPNEESGNERQSFCNIEGNETQTFSAWGEWSRDDIASAINQGCIVRKLDSGICHIFGQTSKGLPNKLQSGFSGLRSKNCDRGGWELALQQKRQGQEEGRKTGFFGVESFEVLEQTDTRLDKYRDSNGSLYFYDLSIERHPSFTINECLVHNSSILKNFDGAIKQNVTAFLKKVKYRFLFTATPSPNDFIELGTSSEALGYLGHTDMLTRFFTNNEDTISPVNIGTEWILKGHAKENFFKWVSGWSISMRNPADLGFDGSKHILPKKIETQHSVKNEENLVVNGQIQLFNQIAKRLTEVREENKMTIAKRCEKAFDLASAHDMSVYWCNLNAEGDLLQSYDKSAYQIKGSMDLDKKEELLLGFFNGDIKKLITKAKMTAFGLNWQHCNHTVYFPTFSYEQYYQAIRRFWRFGQKREVFIDLVFSDGQKRVLDSLIAKTAKANELFDKLNININQKYDIVNKDFSHPITLPTWLKNN